MYETNDDNSGDDDGDGDDVHIPANLSLTWSLLAWTLPSLDTSICIRL